jgi:hypothetical protein
MRYCKTIIVVILSFVMSAVAGSCSQELGPDAAPVKAVVLCKNIDEKTQEPRDITNTFSVNDTVYCSLKLIDEAPLTLIKARWIYVRGEMSDWQETAFGEEPHFANYLLKYLSFSFRPFHRSDTGKFVHYKGDYIVKIIIADTPKVSLPFKVQ